MQRVRHGDENEVDVGIVRNVLEVVVGVSASNGNAEAGSHVIQLFDSAAYEAGEATTLCLKYGRNDPLQAVLADTDHGNAALTARVSTPPQAARPAAAPMPSNTSRRAICGAGVAMLEVIFLPADGPMPRVHAI